MSAHELGCLAGLRIVIVEDEALIAMLIEDMLTAREVNVLGVGRTVAEALRLIDNMQPAAVLLDGNLNGTSSAPVATKCDELRIPYLVVTGYGDLIASEPILAKAPRLSKPFKTTGLLQAVAIHLC